MLALFNMAEEATPTNIEQLLELLTAQIVEIQDVATLTLAATGLALKIPDEKTNDKRAIKKMLLRFLNSDAIETQLRF